ncbi:MAG TPA: hypothetical protein VLL05_16220, partial [Terriglobales bacterium]|nr:hypothetical protein [Terriglobales bacterium]
AVADSSDDKPLPLFVNNDGSRSEAQLAWECRELIVRTGTGTSSSERNDNTLGADETSATRGNVQIEAKLSTSGDNLLRYSAAIKRDFYRAIGTLHCIQRERRGD